LGFERGEKESALAGAHELGGLPAGAHEAGGGVGVVAEEEMAELVSDSVTEDGCHADLTDFVNQLGAVKEEVGVTSSAIFGEVGDAHGELVQIEGMLGDSELKMPREISGGAFGWVLLEELRGRTVQPAEFEAGLAEDAGGFRFRLEQDSEGNAHVIVDRDGNL
jgi:hypothetical protein